MAKVGDFYKTETTTPESGGTDAELDREVTTTKMDADIRVRC